MSLHLQAVLLAGGSGSDLFPLNENGVPKALLPVANRALISFPLAALEKAGVSNVLLVCLGEAAASKVSFWVAKQSFGQLQIEVKAVPEGAGSAEALRAVGNHITGEDFFLITGDAVTDAPLKALAATHYVEGCALTALLAQRRVSPAIETKPGKAPRNVDYIGLDAKQKQLLLLTPSPEAVRAVQVPPSALRQGGIISIRADLVDAHVYVVRRSVLFAVLEHKPKFTSIKQEVVPYIVRHQMAPKAELTSPSSSLDADALNAVRPLPGEDFMRLSHSEEELAPGAWPCGALLVGGERYCARVNSLQAYGDVNRDVATGPLAAALLGPPANPKHDNYVEASVTLGAKSTVAAGCVVGRGTALGERCSVKRSVIGAQCKLGAGVKVINSVIMDDVVVAGGCHIQNSVIAAGAQLQERVQLRDCHVGPGYVVSEGAEHRAEVLAKGRPPA